jgi:tyrosyl-tRNA synthetase
MLAAESVKHAPGCSDQGMSFIEFNYALLQAYDFMYQAKHYGCKLQMGGNDQWGNIVAGVDLTRRMLGTSVFGLTFPLITTSTGQKMGKTHAGAVWLDKERTSVYDFYQYWVNTTDDDVDRFLKLFTFLPMERSDELSKLGRRGHQPGQARMLAFEVTKIVHSESEAKKAQTAAEAAFKRRRRQRRRCPPPACRGPSLSSGIPAFQALWRPGCASPAQTPGG